MMLPAFTKKSELGISCESREHHGSAEAVLFDRKSTRLNSSHGYISYPVFCLKKKTTTTSADPPRCRSHLTVEHSLRLMICVDSFLRSFSSAPGERTPRPSGVLATCHSPPAIR